METPPSTTKTTPNTGVKPKEARPLKYLQVPVPPEFTNFERIYRMMVDSCGEKGGRIVEIGAWLGKSAIMMAELIELSGKKIEFTTVDPFVVQPVWDGTFWQFGKDDNSFKPEARDLFLKHRKESGYENAINLIVDYSEGAVAQFEDNSLDAVMIDGAHDRENVAFDLRAWYPKVKSGGIIAGHDFSPHLDWAKDLVAVVHGFVRSLDGQVIYVVDPKAESFYFIKP